MDDYNIYIRPQLNKVDVENKHKEFLSWYQDYHSHLNVMYSMLQSTLKNEIPTYNKFCKCIYDNTNLKSYIKSNKNII